MKKLVRKLVSSFGYEIIRKQEPFGALGQFLGKMRDLGFKPSFVIDVGANHGHWARKLLSYYPDVSMLMVEPQEHLKADVQDLLQRPNIKWITAGAGARNETMKFTIGVADYSSTFHPTAEEAARDGLRQIDVPVWTLNHLVAENGGQIPDLVKIDAEGLDLQVIQGASDLVGRTEIFLLEAAVAFAGFQETKVLRVLRTMDELGYELIGITDLIYSPAQRVLWLAELAFLKKRGTLIGQVTSEF